MPNVRNYYTAAAPYGTQRSTLTVTGTPGSKTWSILVGGVTIAQYAAGVSDTPSQVAQSLVAAFNTSQHLYVKGLIRAEDETGIAAGQFALYATQAGWPFYEVVDWTPSAGAGVTRVVTPPRGPNVMNDDNNWSLGHAPGTGEIAVFKDIPNVNVCWAVDGPTELGPTAYPMAGIEHYDSFTGRVGLDPNRYCVTSDGNGFIDGVAEYRGTHLYTFADPADSGADASYEVGLPTGLHPRSASSRFMLRVLAPNAKIATIRVWRDDPSRLDDANRLATRIVSERSGTGVVNLFVHSGSGGVGVGTDRDEACVLDDVVVHGSQQKLVLGRNTVWKTLDVRAGTQHRVYHTDAAQTVVVRRGATVRLLGDKKIAVVEAWGKVEIEHFLAVSATELGSLLVRDGGFVDFEVSHGSGTMVIDTATMDIGASMRYNPARVTFTSLDVTGVDKPQVLKVEA